MTDLASTITEIFRAVETRDAGAFARLCHPGVTFHWPPSLPYGSAARSADGLGRTGPGARPSFEETWDPLQPTAAERAMDPRVVGTGGNEVVVLWHQRGVDSAGHRLDEEVLGLYQVMDDRLARARMFYFDPARVAAFLAAAVTFPHAGSSC